MNRVKIDKLMILKILCILFSIPTKTNAKIFNNPKVISKVIISSNKIEFSDKLKEIFELHLNQNEIENINGFSVPYRENVLMEFVIKTPTSAIEIAAKALKQNIFINTINLIKSNI